MKRAKLTSSGMVNNESGKTRRALPISLNRKSIVSSRKVMKDSLLFTLTMIAMLTK